MGDRASSANNLSHNDKTHTSNGSSMIALNKTQSRSPNAARNPEMKPQLTYKNSLPFKEHPQRSLSAYKENKAFVHSRETNRQARYTDSPEKNIPYFQMLNSQQVPFKLRYGDVVLTLLRIVVLLYNKFSEVSQIEHQSMFDTMSNLLNSIDEHLVDKILKEIGSDLNYVARRKSTFYLA